MVATLSPPHPSQIADHTDISPQFNPGYYEDDEMMGGMGGMYPSGTLRPRTGGPPRRFDEYYRCYPVAMLPGPERENVNHGGKVIMPPSALDKLTRLHITYPMLFELINGAKDTQTHAGVLEFIAEEGKIYLPYWMLQSLALEPGDLLQIKSTDLPPGSFTKLQAQSTSFLDISDPKAVLENAFRNFACLTTGDIFTFAYNDQVYEMAVLETRPATSISVIETDLEVDFAAPLGYVEPQRSSGTSTPRSNALPAGGHLQPTGTMATSINYASIAPSSTTAAAGAKATSSNFLHGGHKLKGSKTPITPQASTPVAGASTNAPPQPRNTTVRKTNGPQPLRLRPGQLFFGYEIKPLKKKKTSENAEEDALAEESKPQFFTGQGQTLRGGVAKKAVAPPKKDAAPAKTVPSAGRTLRDPPTL